MYIWKLTQHMVPNIEGIEEHQLKTRSLLWHRTRCVIYRVPNIQRPSQHHRQENAITIFLPRLFNSLPKYLRDMRSLQIEKFKLELDKFIELIPDEVKMPNYVIATRSNSVFCQQAHRRAQLRTLNGGGVFDLAVEQTSLLRN